MHIVILLLGILASEGVQALSLSPTVSSYTISEKPARLTIENPSDEKVAVQIDFFERVTKDGKEVREKTDWFSVSPEQVVLNAHDVRTVSVIWKGPESLEGEKPFRVVVTQLPLSFKKDSPPPKVVLQIIGSIIARPRDEKVRRF